MSSQSKSGFADFAEPFCAGWLALRDQGDPGDAAKFMALISDAYERSGSRRALKVLGLVDTDMVVGLRHQDADALLAAVEAALNAGIDFGPGMPARVVEEAARRVESVAALARRGIAS